MNDLLEYALLYAKKGWPVLPLHSPVNGACDCGRNCDSPAKHPRTRHGLSDATTDPEKITQWWTQWPNANIGICPGKESGFFVIDIDGQQAQEAIKDLHHPPTPIVITGRAEGGGEHRYYQYPDLDLHSISSVQGFSNIDIRRDRNYVVAPPSTHISGKKYTWVDGLDMTAELAPAPDWIKTALGRGSSSDIKMPPGEIREGEGRNTMLTRYVGRLANIGTSWEEIEALTKELNAMRCVPPLSDDELMSTVLAPSKKKWIKEAPSPEDTLKITDVANAELFVHMWKDTVRYLHYGKQSTWLIFNGSYWAPDSKDKVTQMAIKTMQHKQEAIIKDTSLEPEVKTKLLRSAASLQSKTKITAMLALATSYPAIATTIDDGWNEETMKFVCTNGVLDLTTGKLEPGDPADKLSMSSHVRFDPDATCPRWDRFIREITLDRPELAEYLQKITGYALSGSLSEQSVYFCFGGGSNGKSIFFSTLLAVFGDYGWPAPDNLLRDSKYKSGADNEVAGLRSRRLVVSSEVLSSTRVDLDLLKKLSGGDKINPRLLYSENKPFQPQCKIWAYINALPTIKDPSHAVWRRLKIIPFDAKFEGDNREDEDVLKKTLESEASGILNWLLEGCLKWQQDKPIPIPATVITTTNFYKEESNPLGNWLSECCTEEDDTFTTSRDLYNSYLEFSRNNGEDPLTNTKFGVLLNSLYQKGRERIDGRKYTGYYGITLINDIFDMSSKDTPTVASNQDAEEESDRLFKEAMENTAR